ncbi:hypothetical protein VCHA48O428_300042 [Vibrio chagasii]|nr:hypothetical protein VCHA48O428_300042 [Vibrio chagasii]
MSIKLHLYGQYIRLPSITESYKLVKSFDSFIMNEKENIMQSLTANTAKTKFGDLLMKVQREPVQINKPLWTIHQITFNHRIIQIG